jgi:membrane protein required for colicin V production
MNIVDVCIIGAALVTLLIGISRGFVREFSSIMAWVLAGIATFWDIPILRTFMRSKIESALISDVIAALCVFTIAFIIISLIGTIFSGIIRGTIVSPIDRALGMLLGFLKGIVLVCCFNIVAECFVLRRDMPEPIKQSVIMNCYLYDVSEAIKSVLPNDVKEFLNSLSEKDGSLASEEHVKDSRKDEVSENDVENLSILRPKQSDAEEGNYTKQQNDQLKMLVVNEGNDNAV